MFLIWWRLLSSPANPNELLSVELSWAWEPMYRERELGKIIQAKDPSVMFIAETWTDVAKLDQVIKNINFDNKGVVPKEGHGGGLALFWKSSINLVIEDSSSYFIDTWIDKNKEHEWRFTSFYGELATSRRCEAWDVLRTFNHQTRCPFVVCR